MSGGYQPPSDTAIPASLLCPVQTEHDTQLGPCVICVPLSRSLARQGWPLGRSTPLPDDGAVQLGPCRAIFSENV